ncbi:GntR family transcriptional regulator [Stutzerimonas tarimensis]|uniref:GntR family transcriptional regulator n=1 Tax=Stutzerimonas tarimensis TaxID=1507735 RepID=A0ABV7T264_9GAMM
MNQSDRKKRSGAQDDIVYAHIFDAILEQRLAPATRLSEEALGEIFGVSRTVIRRALSRLAHEGVVSLRPNRGAVVACPNAAEAVEILHARRLVELAIIRLAALRATHEDLAGLRALVAAERDCLARGDRGASIRLSGEFHLRLAEAAGNAPLLGFQRSLVSQTSLIIARYERGPGDHCACEEHDALLDALAARNTEQAVALMAHHLDHIDARLQLDAERSSTDLRSVFSQVVQARSG